MIFTLAHSNINITNVKKSIEFYQNALGLKVVKTFEPEDKSFILTYLADDTNNYQLELTWLKGHPQKYDLGENESHICFVVDDFEAAYQLHKEMDCICYENTAMGLYFISDPDGYWLEIVPSNR